MMELEEFKRFLGNSAKEFNDSQLSEVRKEMYDLAEILLDYYLITQKKSGGKKHRNFDGPNVGL